MPGILDASVPAQWRQLKKSSGWASSARGKWYFDKQTPHVQNQQLIRFKGLGIALVAAQKAGVPVTLVDTNQGSIDKGLKFAGEVFFLTLLSFS